MLNNKIYDYVKTYISDYLFGFDKSQLDTSLFNGRVKLKRVNIKPEKINELIDRALIPINIKAGIIGLLELKIGNLSMDMWSIPLYMTIDTLLLIVGPSTSHMSHDTSFQQDSNGEYDEDNAYNINSHKLKMKSADFNRSDYMKMVNKK